MLPDLLIPNLKLIICGTAAGNTSAVKQQYYAGPGNKFYDILYKTGMTLELLSPSNYAQLLFCDIGLTDLVKSKSGMDYTLKKEHFDVTGFKSKIEKYNPAILCFNGKEASRVFLNLSSTSQITYGLQSKNFGNTKLFVAPSTSGAANGSWDERYWFDLKELLK